MAGILLLALCDAYSQKKTVLSPANFEEQIGNANIQLLDVRTMEEYTAGHIKNSLQANWLDENEFKDRVHYLNKTKPIYVYCASGSRSSNAARFLRKEGFQVFELQNGTTGWTRDNRALERDSVSQQMSASEYNALLKTSSIVLIDFGAKWCPPCKTMEPVLEQLQNELRQKFTLIKVDAGIHTDVMKQTQVEQLPTFILYKGGKEVWRKNGLVTLEELKSHIQ